MSNPYGLQRYGTADLGDLMDRITKNSIGLDTYFENIFNVGQQQSYPPYNIVHVNNVESRLEIALAGFKKKEIKVYTEYGKLVVEGTKENKEDQEYLHRGLASRSFKREWSLSDDIEVKDVTFADGLLTAKLGKIIPDHHARKDYL
jgi:molecular chaperone IbpA|tara:strand:- start:513 stop:950 length:438 start_codon:yes stop_codon:yes gene_type:complete